MNLVILSGFIGHTPKIRYTQDGTAVSEFSVATNNGKDKPSDWHNIVAWDKNATFVVSYLQSGSPVEVQGKLQTRSWDDEQSGQKKYKTEVVAHRVSFPPKNNKPDALPNLQ